jgi:hypothetical protein
MLDVFSWIGDFFNLYLGNIVVPLPGGGSEYFGVTLGYFIALSLIGSFVVAFFKRAKGR